VASADITRGLEYFPARPTCLAALLPPAPARSIVVLVTRSDPVNHPPHNLHGPNEVLDLIEGFGLGYHLGNVIKYVLRADHKAAPVTDLEKARWYLDREIGRRTRAEAAGS
jgi:hypothetical protein